MNSIALTQNGIDEAKFQHSTLMSSREIADLTGKQHSNVCRDIRHMLQQIGEAELKFEFSYCGEGGRKYVEFRLPQDLTLTLISGYHAKVRVAIIKRWLQLEQEEHERVLQSLAPKALLGSLVAETGHLLGDFVRCLPGVNTQQVRRTLQELGYLFQKGTYKWRVRAKYRDLFEEKFGPNGLGWGQITVTQKGALKLAELYSDGQLPMRKNYAPEAFEGASF
nr:Rha family transcriptional regulator [uncultured Cohaesibacter sp.]